MAVTYGFFNSVNGDRKYDADQMSAYFRGIVTQGVFQSLDGGLAVTAGTGLAVNVATGRAIVQDKWVNNDLAMTLTISDASATYPRYDAVVIKYDGSARTVSIYVKAGTPAASPSYPTMTRSGTTYEMCLAYVSVPANATSVTVTDKRSDTSVCGWATVAQSISGTYEAMIDDMKTGFDGVVYNSPGDAVRSCDEKIVSMFSEIDYTYKVKDATCPLTGPTDVSTGYTWDFAQPCYVTITNDGASAGYFAVAMYQNSTLKQRLIQLINPGESYTYTLFYANTDGIHGWMESNKYFTNYTWNIYIQNTNSRTAHYSIYTKKDESPIRSDYPYSNTILVAPNGYNEPHFNDISDAVAYAKSKYSVASVPVTIYIKKGVYNFSPVDSRNAVIDKGANMISLVGEDRESTIISLTSTPAHNNKIIEHGGPSVIKNLTMKNLWNDDGSTHVYTHNSYCIHNDLAYAATGEYETVVENCYLYSEAFAPVGAGLKDKQKQIYRNSTFVFNSLDTTPGGYNQWAALYVHGPSSADAADCSLEIDGCNCIALKGTKALTLPNVSGSLQYTDIPVTIRRTIGYTNGSTMSDVSSATHDIQPGSALNNVSDWDYSD